MRAATIKHTYLATAVAGAGLIAVLALTCGCGPGASQDQPEAIASPAAAPSAAPGDRVITDLSQLSSASTAPALVPDAMPASTPAPGATSVNSNAAVQRNIDRFYASNPDALRYSDETPPPGDTRLLNAKAEKFADFGYGLLHQTLLAEQASEAEYLKKRRLPDDLRPVILTATMTPMGRLTDIAIEQHSGDQTIDKMVIEACKKGLWSRNPPAGALAAGGVFRLRIQASINNYSFDRNDDYTYDTHLGLAIL